MSHYTGHSAEQRVFSQAGHRPAGKAGMRMMEEAELVHRLSAEVPWGGSGLQQEPAYILERPLGKKICTNPKHLLWPFIVRVCV